MQEDIINLESQLRQLKSIENDFDPEILTFTNRAAASVGAFLDKAGIENNTFGTREALEQQARVKPKIKEFFNQYRKQITGAAAAVAELKDLEEATLAFNISPIEFQTRFEETKKTAARELEAKKRLLIEGIDVSKSQENILPAGVTEEDIIFTLKNNPSVTREQLLRKLGVN